MDGLLIVLALIILFHNALLIFNQLRQPPARRSVWVLLIEGLMASAAVLAMVQGLWEVLVLSFGVYRLILMGQSIWFSLQRRRCLSYMVGVDALLIAGAIVCWTTGWWWLFAPSYVVFWVLSFIVAKRAMEKTVPVGQ